MAPCYRSVETSSSRMHWESPSHFLVNNQVKLFAMK